MAIFDPTGARATVPTGPTGISIPTRPAHLTAPAASPVIPGRPILRPGGLYNSARRFNRGGSRL